MISVIDYDMGNLLSLCNQLDYLGSPYQVIRSAEEILAADKIILPGVGSYNEAMKHIKSRQIDKCLQEVFDRKNTPVLGICIGMQILCSMGEEGGITEGFGLFSGEILAFEKNAAKLPHVGYNSIEICNDKNGLFKGIPSGSDFYFTHSYRLKTLKIEQVTSQCNNGEVFIASMEEGNIMALQFHPELSQSNGLKLMKNFIEM